MRILAIEHEVDLRQELARVGADECCWDIFSAKHHPLAFFIPGISTATANILKQVALGCGGDCAVHRGIVSGRRKRTDAVLLITRRRFPELCSRLAVQPDCVARLVPGLSGLEQLACGRKRIINVGGKNIDLAARTHVMGIVNITPDSFYDGGRWLEPGAAVEQTLRLADEGADFIDIGAESTRPGSESVPPAEQTRRLLPVLRGLKGRLRVPISVDTTNSEVARRALTEGAAMVNDISGLSADPKMARVVARAGVPCVLMHLPAAPKVMQRRPRYSNLMAEIVSRLAEAVQQATTAGIRREQLVVDPGLGFGKTVEHNLEIIRRLRELATFGCPVLLGPSRKGFIGKLLGVETGKRLAGTLAVCVLAARNGASILRVHDVKPVVQALQIHDAVELAADETRKV